eukprot:TRINITY_DN14658_c0_g1_i3.p1 TRINITY_DN14658_c0_g1~~TRINITY_DN14658_c0_g1_i3.p1  ORF type:complete len:197 (+),score=45.50 TRINITY_DN14658_c0_g1_i3:94-684(+)
MCIRDRFSGSPFAGNMLRILGAKVGKHCFFHGMWACEWDMFQCGDNVCIHYCDMQTHLFEDRVFKCNPVKLGHDVTISPLSLALPNTQLQDGVTIGAKSCVMQGETIPADTRWQGAPMSLIKQKATAVKSTILSVHSRRLAVSKVATKRTRRVNSRRPPSFPPPSAPPSAPSTASSMSSTDGKRTTRRGQNALMLP